MELLQRLIIPYAICRFNVCYIPLLNIFLYLHDKETCKKGSTSCLGRCPPELLQTKGKRIICQKCYLKRSWQGLLDTHKGYHGILHDTYELIRRHWMAVPSTLPDSAQGSHPLESSFWPPKAQRERETLFCQRYELIPHFCPGVLQHLVYFCDTALLSLYCNCSLSFPLLQLLLFLPYTQPSY